MQRRTTTRQRRSSDAAVLIRYAEEEEEEEVVEEEEEEEEGVSDGSDFEWGHDKRKRATTTPRRRKSWPQKRQKRSSSNARKTKVKKEVAEKGEEEEGTVVDEALLRWDGLEGAAAAEAHRAVHALLVGLYGRPEPRQDPEGGSRSSANCCGRKETVLEALISIVLSQNTSDRNSRAAYRGLKTRFPSPAGNEEVKEEAKEETSDATANANQAKEKRLLPVKKEKKEDGESENYTENKIKEEEEEEEEKDDKREVKVKKEASTTIDMEAVRLSKVEDIEDAIRPGGLAKTKARRIKALLQQIHEERGGSTSLEFLRDMPTEELKGYLRKFDGVGPKTISCLLLFTLCRDDMPVDTHVARVSRRLGWVKHNSSREGAYEHLNLHTPDELKYDLHNLLIAHGRKLCRSSNPICEQCPLRQQHCLYYKHAIEGKNDSSSTKKSQKIQLDENYFRSALAQIEEKLEDEELKRKKTTTVKKERIKREKKDA
ncbi:Endonuclease III [Balamuthia mandrillaris]